MVGITLVGNNCELHAYIICDKSREHLALVPMWQESQTSSQFQPCHMSYMWQESRIRFAIIATYIACSKSRELGSRLLPHM